MQSIKVRHNFEAAHRLTKTPGKCENIHGHSFWCELEIGGQVDDAGLMGGLDFGEVKKAFRDMLDTLYDHQLLLNKDDQLIGAMGIGRELPGQIVFDGDPTTENLARWIGQDMRVYFGHAFHYRVTLWETQVNCATWEG